MHIIIVCSLVYGDVKSMVSIADLAFFCGETCGGATSCLFFVDLLVDDDVDDDVDDEVDDESAEEED